MRSTRTLWRAGLCSSALILLCGAGLPAAAQTQEETLVQTYQSNPTLRAARAQLRATNERVPQALSNWRPTVELQGSAGTAYDMDDKPRHRHRR